MHTDTTCDWLGTAGWIIHHGDTKLVSDPYLSRPAGVAPFPKPESALADADLLLCTHGHFDHAYDMERVARLGGALIWAPAVVCDRLRAAGIDPTRLHDNESAGVTRVGDIGLEVIRSKHIRYDVPLVTETLTAVIRGGKFREILALGRGWPMGSNSDYLLYLGPHRIYLSGSLGQDPRELRRYDVDVALLPYNGRTDMARVSAVAARNLNPRMMVFHHWDDFYPDFAPPQDPALAIPMLRRQFPHIRFHVARIDEPFSLAEHLGR